MKLLSFILLAHSTIFCFLYAKNSIDIPDVIRIRKAGKYTILNKDQRGRFLEIWKVGTPVKKVLKQDRLVKIKISDISVQFCKIGKEQSLEPYLTIPIGEHSFLPNNYRLPESKQNEFVVLIKQAISH